MGLLPHIHKIFRVEIGFWEERRICLTLVKLEVTFAGFDAGEDVGQGNKVLD